MVVVVTFAAFAQVAAPLIYQQEWYDQRIGDVWVVDTLWKALVAAVGGVLLGFVLLHVINGIARVWGLIATALLGPSYSASDTNQRTQTREDTPRATNA